MDRKPSSATPAPGSRRCARGLSHRVSPRRAAARPPTSPWWFALASPSTSELAGDQRAARCLAHRGARNGAHGDHPLGPLERGQHVAGERVGPSRGDRRRHLGRRDHERGDHLAPPLVSQSDHAKIIELSAAGERRGRLVRGVGDGVVHHEQPDPGVAQAGAWLVDPRTGGQRHRARTEFPRAGAGWSAAHRRAAEADALPGVYAHTGQRAGQLVARGSHPAKPPGAADSEPRGVSFGGPAQVVRHIRVRPTATICFRWYCLVLSRHHLSNRRTFEANRPLRTLAA